MHAYCRLFMLLEDPRTWIWPRMRRCVSIQVPIEKDSYWTEITVLVGLKKNSHLRCGVAASASASASVVFVDVGLLESDIYFEIKSLGFLTLSWYLAKAQWYKQFNNINRKRTLRFRTNKLYEQEGNVKTVCRIIALKCQGSCRMQAGRLALW